MEEKKTILVVEDETDYQEMMRPNFAKFFPHEKYDLVFTGNFMQAAEVLCDPATHVAGVVLDNGFALATGTERKGAAYKVERESYGEVLAHIREGSAGSLLLRFMRSGDPQAQSEESRAALADLEPNMQQWLGEGRAQRMAELKDVPVVWNSAHPALGKMHEVANAAEGKLSDPDDPKISTETLGVSGNDMIDVGNKTWCSDKKFGRVFDCLSRNVEPEIARPTPPTYNLKQLATLRNITPRTVT